MENTTKIKCSSLLERSVSFVVLIMILFLTCYYVYKGLEFSIRERLLNEGQCVTTALPLFSNNHNEIPTYSVNGGIASTTTFAVTTTTAKEKELTPSAPPPPLSPLPILSPDNVPPPPPYNEVTPFWNWNSNSYNNNNNHNNNGYDYFPTGPTDLEWYRVFDAFNERRMLTAALWTPIPSGRSLNRCLKTVDNFLHAETHPISEKDILKFLKDFLALTNLVYAEQKAKTRVNVENAFPPFIDNNYNITFNEAYKDRFVRAFALLLAEYMPKTEITNRKVPFGYDWFVFSGRLTYAVINAHITLCCVEKSAMPFFCGRGSVFTRTVVNGLKNVCANFTESLGFDRYGSNRVYIGVAFLYAGLLEKACACFETNIKNEIANVLNREPLPDYVTTLNEILFDPSNRYNEFKTLIEEIGKSELISPTSLSTAVKRNIVTATADVPIGAQRGQFTYDGVYDDRSFFAHRRLRMYAYIRAYCEQLFSWQLLTRETQLDGNRLAALLRAVEPMNGDGDLFYFNLHSRTGSFKYRNGSAMFAALNLTQFASQSGVSTTTITADTLAPSSSSSPFSSLPLLYGRVYVADKARILFVQSPTFNFHSIGQLSDLAYGEIERSNRDLMPAWLMGQRPIYRAERNRLKDVPCGAHLEPCVINTGHSEGLQLNLIGARNTTDYIPAKALSAVVVFEEEGIGAVFTCVNEINMDVRYSRCTVATPHYTFTTYFHITRNNNSKDNDIDNKSISLSCYTGCAAASTVTAADAATTDNKRYCFIFKYCTVRVFVQTQDGNSYTGDAIAVKQKSGLEKRSASKCKYKPDQLENVSLVLSPYGDKANAAAKLYGSITILYTPNDDKEFSVPKWKLDSYPNPLVTIITEGVYKIKVDSMYVLYCDTIKEILILVNVLHRRVCLSSLCYFVAEVRTVNDLLEAASAVLSKTYGALIFDTVCNNRVYAYFTKFKRGPEEE